MRKRQDKGFTLVELMITIAVVGILSALAYSAYAAQVRRTRSAQLREGLLSEATQLERSAVANNTYPAGASPRYGDHFAYDYSTNDARTRFALSGSSTQYKIWSGVNSAGTRCACSDCSPPAEFTAETRTCPTGSSAF